jgi:uncharacterized protein (DUF2235 family)
MRRPETWRIYHLPGHLATAMQGRAMKRLIVCCDGTWNRPDQLDKGVAAPANVAKLALAETDADGNR